MTNGKVAMYWLANALVVFSVATLIKTKPNALKASVGVASVASVAKFVHDGDFSYTSIGRLSKVVVTAPLGLGIILLFRDLDDHKKKRYMGVFTKYINLAVVGNIAMMAFVPSDGQQRALIGKAACASLVVWLLQEMRKDEWNTIEFDENGGFVFRSVPISWVRAHAAYRLVLMTLPCFDSLKYVFLEPTSLSLMYLLHQEYDRENQRPMSDYFGFADTITAALTALTSVMISVEGVPLNWTSYGVSQPLLDGIGSAVQAMVLAFSCSNIVRNASS